MVNPAISPVLCFLLFLFSVNNFLHQFYSIHLSGHMENKRCLKQMLVNNIKLYSSLDL